MIDRRPKLILRCRGVTTIVLLRRLPSVAALPPTLHGRPAVAIGVCYADPPERSGRAIAPFRNLGEVLVDTIAPRPFAAHQTMLDASQPAGRRYYWRSLNFAGLSAALIDTLCDIANDLSSRHSMVGLFQVGGRVAAVPDRDSAYPGRDAAFVVNLASSWEDPEEDDRHIAWTRRAWQRLRPHADHGLYRNFAADGISARQALGTTRYRRLLQIKRRHDPDGVFDVRHTVDATAPRP